ncbi:MAG: hypothetical protein ACLGI9_23280, partial [Thermoanaerobaculia bacterium]
MTNDRPARLPRRYRAIVVTAILVAALPLVVLAFLDIPYVTPASQVLLAGIAVLGLLWLLWKAYRSFLYKVGRRLAFSYFLLGVLPIPLVLVLLTVVGYILAGFYLGQLYRDALQDLNVELRTLARERAAVFAQAGRPAGGSEDNVAFAYYRGGRRVGGDPRLPRTWPAWLEVQPDAAHFVEPEDGTATLATAASREGAGVVALWTGRLDQEISRRGDLWIEITRPDDPNIVRLEMFGRRLPLRRINREKEEAGESEKFFKHRSQGEGY